jgi:hypothetical protein
VLFLVQIFISSDGCEDVYKGCNKMAKPLRELYEEVRMTIDKLGCRKCMWIIEGNLGAKGLKGATIAPKWLLLGEYSWNILFKYFFKYYFANFLFKNFL